jgi:3'DNA-binding domain (3'BD)
MYISVIPLRLSLTKHPYTYFVGDDWKVWLKAGYLVEIPLGKNIVQWIIASLDGIIPENVRKEDIRAIIRVIASVELIDPYMISMIENIANRYFLPIHKVASMFLPSPLLSRLDKKNYLLESLPKKEYSEKRTILHHYIQSIFSPESLEKYLKPGSVFIFPDDILLSIFIDSLDAPLKEIIWGYPGNLTPAKRVRAWCDIYSKKYPIIFWTRRILYYNLSAYEEILYVEDAFGMEQYQYPIKIQNLDILKALEKAKKHSITLISSTPTLGLLSNFGNAKIESIH